tara:strand:- start:998 stop:1327 length:330 start_codon:yes stop_codon:yes gene_type:complete
LEHTSPVSFVRQIRQWPEERFAMPVLTPYQDYDREDIHDIFAPETPFTKGSGTWGNWGILPIPDRPNDFVFIVSYGRSMSGHTFEESITEDGVITWQSQPGQSLGDEQI